ncbi:RecT family recombinase [Desertibacillus haloalkaliphilus]|uniref:RecT family recombinase n=1 Tax=Desertibacillus haloalkaliphilus TaxID=1328930 RepID=UPI001C26EA5B|nr:RecT family recombinase [Desertibacillus haloalkaliphilus]MBU8908544.1 recombinase RecT [Desertibacillus haloalkaliphilus]
MSEQEHQNNARNELVGAEKHELQNKPNGALLQFSPEKVQVLKNTVAKGATDDELEMFLHLASRYQLDPFAKEIWFLKRPKKVKDSRGNWDYKRLPSGEIDYEGVEPIIMTSRDGYVKVAQTDPDFEELNSFEIRSKDKFSFNPMTKEIQHELGAERGHITGAWAICKRKGREPAMIVVDFQEYKNAAGKNPVWDNYPSAMIRKVAEVIVLKRQFNISGLVTQEEMPAQYTLEYDDPNLKRIEPNPDKKQTAIDPKQEWKELSHAIKEKREILGLNGEQMKVVSTDELGLSANPASWSIADLKKVIGYLDQKINALEHSKSSNEQDMQNDFNSVLEEEQHDK